MVSRIATTDLPPAVTGSFLLDSAPGRRRDMLGGCERASAAYGDVVRVVVGPPVFRRELYLMFHPDAAHRVLAANALNYRKDNLFYTEVRGLFGDGLLTSQDVRWQRQKRFLQPLFTAQRVAGYVEGMTEVVESLTAQWHVRGTEAIDLDDEMTRLTLRIVCRVLFGADVDDAVPVVQRAFGPLGEAVRRRATAPVRLPLRWPTRTNRPGIRAQRDLYEVCDGIIARRRAAPDAQQDLIGLLLNSRVDGVALTDTEIRDQVLIFLLAGHETTSTALTYTLHLLGRHGDVQQRVREEVDAIIGDREPTAHDAAALSYTTMVLKEAMRLYPSVPLVSRRAAADDEVCGYRVPAGSDVILAPWVIHRHPAFWDDPARFDPTRFTPAREKARHRYAWFPFGGGPRGCIGQHFSMLEAAVILAVLVRDFDFTSPAGELSYTNHITLRPVDGVPSLITQRR
ncbi:MAG TPA: cytochrome P450 [Mycobacteriales bacterium]|jgi:cytochrome P450|nr:cytochrome P450 [Mycobacteriales bacterium]